ncbi:MAG: FliO/MopB family protein [Oscillospiraceae bacterium]
MEDFLNIAGMLAVMLLVIFAAYYATRFVALKTRTGFGKPRYFKLIDRFNISKDKMIVLVSVGQNAYLVGITNQTVTLIDTIELSDIKQQEKPSEEAKFCFKPGMRDLSFRSFLNQVKVNSGYSADNGAESGVGNGDENNNAE